MKYYLIIEHIVEWTGSEFRKGTLCITEGKEIKFVSGNKKLILFFSYWERETQKESDYYISP